MPLQILTAGISTVTICIVFSVETENVNHKMPSGIQAGSYSSNYTNDGSKIQRALGNKGNLEQTESKYATRRERLRAEYEL
jgi:hypothetical protein